LVRGGKFCSISASQAEDPHVQNVGGERENDHKTSGGVGSLLWAGQGKQQIAKKEKTPPSENS